MATRIVTAEEEGLAGAVADTEAEIFAEASGTEALERTGDNSLETMGEGLEGDHVEEDVEAEGESEPEVKEGDPPRDPEGKFAKEPEQQRGVPPGRLREEGEKRRAAEAAAAEKDQRLTTLQREFDALKAGLTAPKPQVQEPQKIEAPDMFAEPEKWQQYVIAQADQRASMRLVEGSLADAADTHGDKFSAAYTELQNIGRTEKAQFGSSPTVSKIWSSPNPGKALMKWHTEQSTVREIGGDLSAYREKHQQELLSNPEFLAKAIEAAKGSARQGDNGRPRTATRLPPSLNGQTGASHQASDPELYDSSEGSVFEYATRQ